MKRTRNLSLPMAGLMLAVLACTALAGCASGKSWQGSGRDVVSAYSEPIADNLFQGMNSGHYATFSRDFNAQMVKGIPAETFTSSILSNIAGKLGNYVSRQVDGVTQAGSNVLVIYTAKFEKDDKVTIRLSLEQADPHHVSGLYFSSPTLSQK